MKLYIYQEKTVIFISRINMSVQKYIKSIFILLILTACAPISTTMPAPTVSDIVLPTATKISNTQPATQSVDELIKIIYASDPALPQYDINSVAYAEFPDALKQLSSMGLGAIDAASHLGVAITFPRQDSYLAAQTLLALGPDITATTLPNLRDNLQSQKPEARMYSAILMGSIGKQASCAVGDLAPLLWDSDPRVRTAAAFALEKTTEQDLISNEYELAVTPSLLANSIMADTPEGKIVGTARAWWAQQGSKVNWHPRYDICDP